MQLHTSFEYICQWCALNIGRQRHPCLLQIWQLWHTKWSLASRKKSAMCSLNFLDRNFMDQSTTMNIVWLSSCFRALCFPSSWLIVRRRCYFHDMMSSTASLCSYWSRMRCSSVRRTSLLCIILAISSIVCLMFSHRSHFIFCMWSHWTL